MSYTFCTINLSDQLSETVNFTTYYSDNADLYASCFPFFGRSVWADGGSKAGMFNLQIDNSALNAGPTMGSAGLIYWKI